MTTFKIAINEIALIEKIPAGDLRWQTYNDAFANCEVTLIDLIDAIWRGRGYAAWHDGRRKHDNFICAQHIACDFDTQDERSSFDHLKRNRFFRLHGSILHETPSHTDNQPKARAIFLLDQPITTVDGYRTALQTVHYFFPSADESCIDPSRFFYGNGKLSKNGRTEGIWFCENTLPLTNLRRYWKQMQMTSRQNGRYGQTRHRSRRPPSRQRNNDPDVDEVAAALKHIDPWSLNYNRWIGIIAALKREVGDQGRQLAEQWADGKPGEVEREWNRLGIERDRTMTLGSIFYLARQNGMEQGSDF